MLPGFLRIQEALPEIQAMRHAPHSHFISSCAVKLPPIFSITLFHNMCRDDRIAVCVYRYLYIVKLAIPIFTLLVNDAILINNLIFTVLHYIIFAIPF